MLHVMKVSQKDIAKKLRVSIATVSKSLNNVPTINPKTRARVIESAMKMGYKLPEHYTRGRSKNNKTKVNLIGQLIMDEQYSTSQKELVDLASVGYSCGMSEVAQTLGFSLVTHYVTPPHSAKITDPKFQPPALRERLLGGVILVHYFPPEVVCELAQQIPLVTISHHVPDATADHIQVNQQNGIGRLVRHLYNLGHQRIGFLSYPVDYSWGHARFAAYVCALSQLGIPYNPDVVCNLKQPRLDTATQVTFVTKQIEQGVKAWVCANDTIAYELCYGLMSNGIRVPHDVSITGFDAAEPRLGCPRLTSIRVPFYDIGVLSVYQLLKRIENPTAQPHMIIVNDQLVEGETTAPPP